MAATQPADDYVAPASPAAYLMWHIVKKGFQAGSVVGVAAVLPAMAIVKKVREPAALLSAVGYSALAGATASGTLGAVKFVQIDKEGFHDRCYRLHYNEAQNRNDAFASAGAALGLAAAAALLLLPYGGGGAAAASGTAATFASSASYGMALAGGSAVGAALGVAAHIATRPADQRYPNKALHELTRGD